MTHPANLQDFFIKNPTVFENHPWPVGAPQWDDVYNKLEHAIDHTQNSDFFNLPTTYQARLLNLAFSHDRLFDLMEDLIAPLWKNRAHLPDLMDCICSATGNDVDPQSEGLLPFVLQIKALEIPEIIQALKMYPSVFSKVFMSRPQPIVLPGVVERWLDLKLITHANAVEWMIAYDQKHRLKDLNIPSSVWTDLLTHQTDMHFLQDILDLVGLNADTAWIMAEHNLPCYDPYEGGFGEWPHRFWSNVFEHVEWDAHKTHVVFERAVSNYDQDLDIGEHFEYLYEAFPSAERHRLHPYLLMFNFARSTELDTVTDQLRNHEQNKTIHASLNSNPAPRTTRKL